MILASILRMCSDACAQFQSQMIFLKPGKKSIYILFIFFYHQPFKAGFSNSRTLQVIGILLQLPQCYSQHEGQGRWPWCPAGIPGSAVAFPPKAALQVCSVIIAQFRWMYLLLQIAFSAPCPSVKQKAIPHFLTCFPVQECSFHFQVFLEFSAKFTIFFLSFLPAL